MVTSNLWGETRGDNSIEVAPAVLVDGGPAYPWRSARTLPAGLSPVFDACATAPDTFIARTDARAAIRDQVLAAYGSRCRCCGETIKRFLTLDHVNNDGAVHRKELQAETISIYAWAVANDYPDVIQILCYNCNLGRALNGGICPHQESK